MALIESIIARAKSNKQRIVLPESLEERTLTAADKSLADDIADIILIGNPDEIFALADKLGLKNIGKATIIDPATSDKTEEYAQLLFQLRQKKGMTIEKARETMKNTLFYACMMIKEGKADGMVSGAINTTGNTLRPGLQIIKMAKGISTISSCFIMEVPKKEYGDNGLMLFGDCAININPNPDELASIAIATANTAKTLLGMEPRVAMLSFSTKGSAKHEHVDKVTDALAKVKELAPELDVEGELQADAAMVPKVAALKAPGSKVAGHANVLIFPDLQSGNIGYKLVQRLAGAEAVGPVSQGFAKPINDLSRGCSIEDIVSVVAITAVQAQAIK